MTHDHREPDAGEAQIMAISTRPIRQSQYCLQNSTRRDSNLVYPRQRIPGLEEEWLIFMGPWKSYASLALSTFVFIN